MLLPQMNRSAGGWCFWLLKDRRLGVHHSNSSSTCLVTSPTMLSQSSKKIWRLTVRGWLPVYSGFPPALVFMLRGAAFQPADLETEISLGLNLNSRLPAPPTSSRRALTIFASGMLAAPHARNPLCESSSVSVAIWLLPMSSEGPFHFTGYTPSRFQVAIGVPSESSAEISAVWRLTSSFRLAIQSVTFFESLLSGRVSLMFWYLARPGMRWT